MFVESMYAKGVNLDGEWKTNHPINMNYVFSFFKTEYKTEMSRLTAIRREDGTMTSRLAPHKVEVPAIAFVNSNKEILAYWLFEDRDQQENQYDKICAKVTWINCNNE